MKSVGKLWLWIVGAMIFFGTLGFVANGMGLISYKFFGPKWEDAKRDVFENTNSFTKAKVQEATKYRLEYLRAKDPVERNAIKVTIAQSLADFDEDKYVKNDELREWISQMKTGSPEPVPIE